METIKSALSDLSCARALTVHLLQSDSRRTQALFEYARTHPRGTTVEDVLVLLYIHLQKDELAEAPPGESAGPQPEEAVPKAEGATVNGGGSSGGTTCTIPAVTAVDGSPSAAVETVPVLLVALQAQVYTISSSSTTVVYIAKADSSAYPLPPSLTRKPYARTLAAAFLAHFLDRKTRPTARTFVQLFARSQPQYLFPDSGDSPHKRVLSGERLCRWWKTVLEHAVARARNGGDGSADDELRLSYILPGMGSYEASLMVGPMTAVYPWIYGLRDLPRMFEPPASDAATATAPTDSNDNSAARNDDDAVSLGDLIPTFEDDPRTRFLTDLTLPPGAAPTPLSSSASSSGIAKPRLAADAEDDEEDDGGEPSLKAKHTALRATASAVRREKASARLRATSEEAFWELLAFRQECSLGQTVGFFALYSAASTLEKDNSPHYPSSDDATPSALVPASTADRKTHGLLPKQLWLRLIATLLNQSFATPALAVRGSATVWDLTQTLVGEWGALDAAEGRVEASVAGNVTSAGGKRKAEQDAEAAASQPPPPPKQLMAVRKKKKVA